MIGRITFLAAAAVLCGQSIRAEAVAAAGADARTMWELSRAAATRGAAEIATRRAVRIEILNGEKVERALDATIRVERDAHGEWAKRIEPEGDQAGLPRAGAAKRPPMGPDAGPGSAGMDEMESGKFLERRLIAVAFTGRTELVGGANCLEAEFSAEGVKGTVLFREADGLCAAARTAWDKDGPRGPRTESTKFVVDAAGRIKPERTLMETEKRLGLLMSRTIRIEIEFEDYARR
jgi:hypothetical protein